MMFKLAQLGVVENRVGDLAQETEKPIPHYRRNMTGRPEIKSEDAEYMARLLLREFPASSNNISQDTTYSNELINA